MPVFTCRAARLTRDRETRSINASILAPYSVRLFGAVKESMAHLDNNTISLSGLGERSKDLAPREEEKKDEDNINAILGAPPTTGSASRRRKVRVSE